MYPLGDGQDHYFWNACCDFCVVDDDEDDGDDARCGCWSVWRLDNRHQKWMGLDVRARWTMSNRHMRLLEIE